MNKKSILVGIAVLLLAVVGGIAGATYSRYISSASTTPTAKVAKWIVKVNDTDITSNSAKTITAPAITWEQSNYIDDNVIAPSRKGTFELKIDPSGSQVAILYTLKIDEKAFSQYPQIKIESVKVGEEVLSKGEDGLYSSTITLDEVKKNTVKTVKVTLTWNEDTQYNTADTTIGNTITNFDIPIEITVQQYLGEAS